MHHYSVKISEYEYVEESYLSFFKSAYMIIFCIIGAIIMLAGCIIIAFQIFKFLEDESIN